MIEGKFTEEEAITQSCDMLGAGVDTVNMCLPYKLLGQYIISKLVI